MFKYIHQFFIAVLMLGATFFQVQAQSSCIGTNGKVDWLIWDNIYSGDLDYLYHQHAYPYSPDEVKQVAEIGTIHNYKNNYASLIRGFIEAPETGAYTFNITGDDNCLFKLSTDDTPANLVDICSVPGYSGVTDHNTYPEQTSSTINLVAGQYYYFEALHAEGYGGDHVHVHWRIPSNPTANWSVIHGAYLYNTTCNVPCAKAGTACDDGNPTTIDDQEDGRCNCTGTPTSLPTCVGERDSILVLHYDGVPGYSVDDMLNSADYPDNPTRGYAGRDPFIYPDYNSPYDEFGTRIRAYLKVPTTGDYTFNVTGDNMVRLLLSTDTDPANATNIAWTWYAGFINHWENATQTSTPITLQANQYYYLEFLHQDGGGGEFYSLYWKTPFQTDTSYQHLDATYLYRYDCETACMPLGLTCDDGDASTFNDQFDANCNCAGTPCADANCTNALDYTPIDVCEATDQHSTYVDDSWLSCQNLQSPNPLRGMSHWIQYDLGQAYILDNAHVWNYNVTGSTGQGFQDVTIDLSLDGINWTELGTYTWGQAPGASTYTGFNMAQFYNQPARYVLVTGLNNFDGSNCMGFSEMRFEATACPSIGTPCDDGLSNTINDVYNAYCNCAGEALVVNDCTDPILNINSIPVISDNYDAIDIVNSAGLVPDASVVSFVAGDCINLNAGFEVELGAEFIADIIQCTPPNPPTEHPDQSKEWMSIQSNENDHSYTVYYNLPQQSKIDLSIVKLSGDPVITLVEGEESAGEFEKTIHTNTLEGGIYMLVFKTDQTQISERLVVLQNN